MILSQVWKFFSNALGIFFVANCSWWSKTSFWWLKGRSSSQVGIITGLQLPSIITWTPKCHHCLVRMAGETFDAIVVIRIIRGNIIDISQLIHSVSHLSSIDRISLQFIIFLLQFRQDLHLGLCPVLNLGIIFINSIWMGVVLVILS